MRKLNLKNKKFGKLKVINESSRNSKNHIMWKCLCECGKTVDVQTTRLTTGATRSCGCLGGGNKRSKTHGDASPITPLYTKWSSMKDRCHSRNPKNKITYSDKGITYCKRWEHYENFKKDMEISFMKHIKKYGLKETVLDRIDSTKNYCQSNCRWVTRKESFNNRLSIPPINTYDNMCLFIDTVNKIKNTDISLSKQEYLDIVNKLRKVYDKK